MGDIGAEASANNAVPGGIVHRIKLRLDNLGNVVKNSLLLEGKASAINGMLLHLRGHILEFHNCESCF